MVVARLTGNIWATRKSDSLVGMKLMLAEILNGSRSGEQLVVVDRIGAGIGDKVLVTCGSAARLICDDVNTPIDAAVIGIIDNDCNS